MFGGIGMPEILIILALALIIIGPQKLPDLAKTLGKAFGEFKKSVNELKNTIEIDEDSPKNLTDIKGKKEVDPEKNGE
ncbi:MAG: twin-arginine translocase subunit TatB [Deltaproteobacteria bacterium]|nr:MAG: twin-arginine translocase subunit TatB [Deltaproteobacteria bacterium]